MFEVKSKMGLSSLTLFSVCVVLVLFVIPYGLISCELGTTYLGEGGIYDWVKRAFGFK